MFESIKVRAQRALLRSAAGLLLFACVAGCGSVAATEPPASPPTVTPRPSRPTPAVTAALTAAPAFTPGPSATPAPPIATATPANSPTPAVFIPAPLSAANLDLHAAAVDVPLEIRIPSLKVSAAVAGVGLTAAGGMDAPEGAANDPVWQKIFWYRGSAVPGAFSTATLAGHVDDILGRPAVFARLKDMKSGDLIFVHDVRAGVDVRFVVRSTQNYTVQQANSPAVLAQVYGSGPVAGGIPTAEVDGLAHLTLITCAGVFTSGSYDHRFVVYATRSDAP